MRKAEIKPHRAEFGKKLRRARANKGLSQGDVADALFVNYSVISKWESGAHGIRQNRIPRLKKLLSLEQTDIDKYLQSELGEHRYIGKTFDQLMLDGYEMGWLLEGVDALLEFWPSPEIDDPALGSNDFGPDAKWAEFMALYPFASFGVIDTLANQMVGYWFVLSISKSVYERGIARENINLELDVFDLVDFHAPKTEHFLYFVDLFTAPSLLMNPLVMRPLRDGFASFLEQIYTNDQKISGILAHASEVAAEKVCRTAGFSPLGDHLYHRRLDARTGKLIPTKVYAADSLAVRQIIGAPIEN